MGGGLSANAVPTLGQCSEIPCPAWINLAALQVHLEKKKYMKTSKHTALHESMDSARWAPSGPEESVPGCPVWTVCVSLLLSFQLRKLPPFSLAMFPSYAKTKVFWPILGFRR